MRWICYAVCIGLVAIQMSYSMPASKENLESLKETLENVDKDLQYTTLESGNREKRTIGVFRRIFPELSKMIDDKVQQLTRVIFRVVGRAVLNNGGLTGTKGRNTGAANSDGDDDSGRRISVILPTYPPDEDEEEEEEQSETETPKSSEGASASLDEAKDNLIPSSEDDSTSSSSSSSSSSNGETKKRSLENYKGLSIINLTNVALKPHTSRRQPSTRQDTCLIDLTQEERVEGVEEVNGLSESASETKEVRVPFGSSSNDLQTAASGEDNEKAESSHEEISDDIEISETDENSRSKRLGVFGNLFGGGGGGGEGGSGNFLFDIVRRTADGAARAAGTVYRLIAGTDNNGPWKGSHDADYYLRPLEAFDEASQTPVTASASTQPTTDFTGFAYPTLVAGSGATEQQDESANSEQGHSSDDGYQTGIPGPITRLFVIANRGLANLVQDLILRLAQTSERLVNFKARLITAII